MSVIAVGGRRYAAGLYWLERGSERATARTARRLGRPWCVHHGERTGFAADDPVETLVPATDVPETLGPGSPEGAAPEGHGTEGPGFAGPGPAGLGPAGLPALALALEAHIEGAFWMALVEGGTSGGGGAGGGGRYALVKARGGAVLADGDEVFEDRESAVAAFERARGLGWALFVTPGLAEETLVPETLAPETPGPKIGGRDVAVLDPAALGEAADAAGAAIVLRPAALARSGRLLFAAALGAAVLAAGAAWFGREALVDWLASPQPAPTAPRPEPTAVVAVDGAALIAACREALIENLPVMPAWRIERIECAARLNDPELTGLVPDLVGRPALLVRWRLLPDHVEALQRRVVEAHLARWHAGQVADGRAWALAPLAPVLRIAGEERPSFLELRRAVDRAFGTGGARVGYVRNAGGAWSVRIDAPGPLARLGPLGGGIDGLEITTLSRGKEGPWRLEGRPVAPETVALAALAALGIAVETIPAAAGMEQPETLVPTTLVPETLVPKKEANDGTDTHDLP